MSETQIDPLEIKGAIHEFILSEFLVGEEPSFLTDDVPLITGGILDSISTARLVEYLESRYGIRFKPHEVGAERLDTLARIVETVEGKLRQRATE